MKVCVLYAPASKGNEKMKAIAKAVAEGVSSQGHMVDVFDMSLETGKIVSFYDYLIIGTETLTFFGGKIPATVSGFLKTAGSISGKRCMAFITKGGLRSMKTLQTLMKAMEKEGMFLKKSEIVNKVDLGRAVGKHIQI
ncbi:MAG: flavodoxin family protein [Sphaerochaeta sp.]